MAGIEDFVVEQIMQDFQQSPTVVQPSSPITGPGAEMIPNASPAPQPGFLQGRQNYVENTANALVSANPRSAVNPNTGLPWGQFADQYETQRVAALNKRDEQQMKLMTGLQGLDPQIQGSILKRLGIDPGAIKGKLEQEKELATHRAALEQPQHDARNALKLLMSTQEGQLKTRELAQKQQQFEAEQGSRGQTQNIQLMHVLATLMQADASGQLTKSLGPILLQMLQGSGINLAPQPTASSAGGRAVADDGIKITRR